MIDVILAAFGALGVGFFLGWHARGETNRQDIAVDIAMYLDDIPGHDGWAPKAIRDRYLGGRIG